MTIEGRAVLRLRVVLVVVVATWKLLSLVESDSLRSEMDAVV